MKKYVVLVMLVAFSASTSWAQAGKRYALVIGNADYQRIDKLKNTINDAEDIGAALKALGYEVELKRNLDHFQMIDAIGTFVARLEENRANEGFFWYAGHAVQMQDENYLLPVDVTVDSEDRVRFGSYPLNGLISALERAHNKVNILVLDSCRNNPLPASARRGENTRGLAVINDVPSDLFVMFSTAPGEKAKDAVGNSRNSPFAMAFLKYINSPQDIYHMYVDVTKETLTLTDNKQRPFQRGSIISEKYYSLNPAGGRLIIDDVDPPEIGDASKVPGSLVITTTTTGTARIVGSSVNELFDMPAQNQRIIENLRVGKYTVTMYYEDGKTEEKTIQIKSAESAKLGFSYRPATEKEKEKAQAKAEKEEAKRQEKIAKEKVMAEKAEARKIKKAEMDEKWQAILHDERRFWSMGADVGSMYGVPALLGLGTMIGAEVYFLDKYGVGWGLLAAFLASPVAFLGAAPSVYYGTFSPVISANFNTTLAPFPYSFIELGGDALFMNPNGTEGEDYMSFYPYANFNIFLGPEGYEHGGFFFGLGTGRMFTMIGAAERDNYKREGSVDLIHDKFALNVIVGGKIGNNPHYADVRFMAGFDFNGGIYYTMLVGYSFRRFSNH